MPTNADKYAEFDAVKAGAETGSYTCGVRLAHARHLHKHHMMISNPP
jgi:hypothetical protein